MWQIDAMGGFFNTRLNPETTESMLKFLDKEYYSISMAVYGYR
jgi:hypothetical protein